MGDPISSGIGLGVVSGVLGDQQQKKIKTGQKNQKKELKGLHGAMLSDLEQGSAQQYQNILKANKAMQEGYQGGINDANRIEGQGARNAKDFFGQALGGADASAAGRGFLGSSMNTGARLGAAQRASRYMTDSQIAASQLRTGARLGLGQAKAQGFQNLANFHAYKAGQKNNLMARYFDFVAGQQHVAQPVNLSGIGQLLGQGFGGGGGGLQNSGPVNNQGIPYFLAAP